jgi:DNA-binding NtrC family response regulator
MLSTSHPEPRNLIGSDGHSGISSGASVLILDADVRLRTALNANFLRHGWQVKTAGSFAEASRVIDQQSFDLVISGLTMRDGDVHKFIADRREYISEDREYTPATPVIVLASHASVADVVQVMRAGAFDVLPRDTGFDQLQQSARNAVHAFGSSESSYSEAPSNAALRNGSSALPAGGMTLSELNRKHLEDALALAEGNRTNAAKVLGISVRTVRNKIRQYGLPPRSYA